MLNKRAVLCVLDGWGVSQDSPGNAITKANPQVYKFLVDNFPSTTLKAAGPAVGLPEGTDGNSETGHLNLGAGRTVYQDLSLINMSIADGSFFTNQTLLTATRHIKSFDSNLHLLGLIGASGVHASNDHLFALMLFAKKQGIKNVYLHLITDGRDSPPDDAVNQVKKVEEKIKEIGIGEIVSVMGRYYAMDRDMRLERTQSAYNCLIQGDNNTNLSAEDFITSQYSKNIFDEFIEPTMITSNFKNTRVKAGDIVCFFNFRTDRPRQLTQFFLEHPLPNQKFITMTPYKKEFNNPTIFGSTVVTKTLGQIISENNYKQLRMAETEKIAMVSYFFNGQSENSFVGEDREFVDSPKVATYDLVPAMATEELVKKFSENFKSSEYAFGLLNIACPDMVAHTGKIDKTIEAVKAADLALGELINLAKETNSYLLITADHGNAEELINHDTGNVDTEHSGSLVPLIIYHPTDNQFKLIQGKLGDVAPTILKLLDIEKPVEMTGNNLIT